nr:hypothetical protein [Lachnospiraceae bacterium]
KDPAIEDVIDYWVTREGLSKTEESVTDNGSVLTKYGSDSGNVSIWNLWIKDSRHAWPNESVNKISGNKYIMDFFNEVKYICKGP